MTGFGIATVDRVLNERGNVAPQTAEKVLAVARRLKLKRILPASHRRLLRIQVILARPELPLIGRMGREFAKLAERVDRSIVIQRKVLKSEAPVLVAEQIRATKCDAIVVYAQEHDVIHAAVDEMFHRGVPVVTMISDLPNSSRLAYFDKVTLRALVEGHRRREVFWLLKLGLDTRIGCGFDIGVDN